MLILIEENYKRKKTKKVIYYAELIYMKMLNCFFKNLPINHKHCNFISFRFVNASRHTDFLSAHEKILFRKKYEQTIVFVYTYLQTFPKDYYELPLLSIFAQMLQECTYRVYALCITIVVHIWVNASEINEQHLTVVYSI